MRVIAFLAIAASLKPAIVQLLACGQDCSGEGQHSKTLHDLDAVEDYSTECESVRSSSTIQKHIASAVEPSKLADAHDLDAALSARWRLQRLVLVLASTDVHGFSAVASKRLWSLMVILVISCLLACLVCVGTSTGLCTPFKKKSSSSAPGQDRKRHSRSQYSREQSQVGDGQEFPPNPAVDPGNYPPHMRPTAQERGISPGALHRLKAGLEVRNKQHITAPHYLCQRLVVPDGNECAFMVPRLPPTGGESSEQGSRTVQDGKGGTVFTVQFNLCYDGEQPSKRIELSFVGGYPLVLRSEGSTPEELTILDETGTIYGVLRKERIEDGSPAMKRYVVEKQSDPPTHLLFPEGASGFDCIDQARRLLATAQYNPMSNGYTHVRIGPHVDAGLVCLALLGIDVIDHDITHQRLRGQVG